MKFLALDIETTGLDLEKSEILQVAAIYVEPGKPDREFNVYIKKPVCYYAELPAIRLNAKTFEKIHECGVSHVEAETRFNKFIDSISDTDPKITVAGKNAATFDIPLLKHWGFNVHQFSHRVLDVGSLYASDFGKIPNLSQINESLGRQPVSHDALDDCRDVVAAIRAKLKK